MRLLFTSRNVAEIGLLRGFLEFEGIECFARNEQISMAMGEVPFLECQPQLWIVSDADWERASAVLSRYHGQQEEKFEAWICPDCGETNEGQFGACWQCDYLIDAGRDF